MADVAAMTSSYNATSRARDRKDQRLAQAGVRAALQQLSARRKKPQNPGGNARDSIISALQSSTSKEVRISSLESSTGIGLNTLRRAVAREAESEAPAFVMSIGIARTKW